MRVTKLDIVNAALVVVSFAVVAALYKVMPEQVPVHWRMDGSADRYVAKPFGPYVGPAFSALLFIVLQALPRISPEGFRMDGFLGPYRWLQLAVHLALLAFCATLALQGLGYTDTTNRVVFFVWGIYFVWAGNLLPKFQRNFFVGVRTPWTLVDDGVWFRAQRRAGWLLVVSGITSCLAGVLGLGVTSIAIAVFASITIPAILSYFDYRRVRRDAPGSA